jgi:hypothetical protein
MGAGASTSGTIAAATYLRYLLGQCAPYRRAWQRYASRWRRLERDELNQAAIAHVLARHIWDVGDADEHHLLPRGLKDRVARALHGDVLSPRTVRLFIDAFGFSDLEANRLWLLLGTPVHEAPYVMKTYPETGHRTMLLHDFCVIGHDGLLREHRAIQVIRAVEAGIDRYRVELGGDVAAVEVLRGGRAGPLAPAGEGQAAVDIEFGRPLAVGETASFEYRVLFGGLTPRPPQFRRSAQRRLDNVEIRLQFDARRPPSRVFWTVWRIGDGSVKSEESVALDDECSVHRYVARLQAAAVGFTWAW